MMEVSQSLKTVLKRLKQKFFNHFPTKQHIVREIAASFPARTPGDPGRGCPWPRDDGATSRALLQAGCAGGAALNLVGNRRGFAHENKIHAPQAYEVRNA